MRMATQRHFVLSFPIVCLFFFDILSDVVAMGINVEWDELEIPTAEITLIWEHYCMKHMERHEWPLARFNKIAIEFQRKYFLHYDAGPERLPHFQKLLEEAQIAKNKAGQSWGCNPPKAKLAFGELKVGQPSEPKAMQSFISNSNSSITVESSAILMDAGCKNPMIEWRIAVPRYGISKAIKGGLVSVHGSEKSWISSSGLSDDETVWPCLITESGTVILMTDTPQCKAIVDKWGSTSSNFMSNVEDQLAIPNAPGGDRGNDFKINVEAKLFCNGHLDDNVNASVGQDEQDQLRQEYLDMGKQVIPKRKDLRDHGDTKHFNLSNFNSSQKVGGGKYQYILSYILDRLGQVQSHAGNIPLIINSGFRNPYKNAKVPGAGKESPHIYGIAVDFEFDDFNRDKEKDHKDREFIFKVAKQTGACVEPEQKTPTWVHLDWREICPKGW